MPGIGAPAPDFEALPTTGPSNLRTSRPTDFTPFCTTELSGFTKRQAEFTPLNTELLGLSIDSSHSAWVNSVREKRG